MASPSLTYTLTNSTTADASEVMQNFNDLLNGITDGTKDLSISALTVSGVLTVSGSVGADLDPTSASTYALGSATLPWQQISVDNGATDGGAVYFNATTTSFIKSSADGLTLDFGAFTTVTLGECTSFEIGDGTDANTVITLNADTGDASLYLQVNNSSANAWSIVNDNSDSDRLKFIYGGTTYYIFDPDGDVEFAGSNTGEQTFLINQESTGDAALVLQVNDSSSNAWTFLNDNSDSDILKIHYGGSNKMFVNTDGSVEADAFLPTGDDTSAPAANRLYKANVPKAWAHLDVGAGSTVTVTNDHNISSASYSGSNLTINIDTNMADDTYAAVGMSNQNQDNNFVGHTYTVGSFILSQQDISDGTQENWASGQGASIIVMGDQ